MDAQQLRQILVLANEFKEGDLAVGGTRDEAVRDEARRALRAMKLGEIRRLALIDDGVTKALSQSLDRELQTALDPLTIDDLTKKLLDPGAPQWIARHRNGLASECIAAAAKVMSV